MAAEDVRLRLRRKMEEMVGVDEADLLLDRPPGGWSELVTKDWLHLELSVIESKIAALDVKFDAKFDALDMKFESKFDAFESKFDAFESKFDAVDGRFDAVDGRFDAVDGRFDAVDGRFAAVDRRLDSIDDNVRNLTSEINKQTWRLMTAMLAGMTILTAVFGAFVAFVAR